MTTSAALGERRVAPTTGAAGVLRSHRPEAPPTVQVRGLTVVYGDRVVVDRVDLDVRSGEVVVLLGASGSGKTTLLRALTGMVPAPGRVHVDAHVLTAGDESLDLADGDVTRWRRARARHLGVVHQDCGLALTPLRRAGSLLAEVLALRGLGEPDDGAVADALRWAGFADPDIVARLRCCELSGGMAQRLGFALAVAGRPALLLADEPTTALDGTARTALVARLRDMADDGSAVVVVTHDAHVAAAVGDTVVVVDDGRVVEKGPADVVLTGADHPVVRLAEATHRRQATTRSIGPPVLELRSITKGFPTTGPVLRGVDLDVAPGEVVGIVGRSGAGKSTLVRTVVGLEVPESGRLSITGRDAATTRWRQLRRVVQLAPQDARATLNPWRSAEQIVADPLAAHRVGTRAQRRLRARELLERVGLGAHADRRPGELSTGQCQRVGIARALAVRPRLVVADEPVASLDAHLRADALALLRAVATEHGTAVLLVSHDLLALETACDRIAVLDGGVVVDDLPAPDLRTGATHPFTRELLGCFPIDPLDALRSRRPTSEDLP